MKKVFEIKSDDSSIRITGRSKSLETVYKWIDTNLPDGTYYVVSLAMPDLLNYRFLRDYKQLSKIKYKP